MIEARKYDRRQTALQTAKADRQLAQQEIDEALRQPIGYSDLNLRAQVRILRGTAR